MSLDRVRNAVEGLGYKADPIRNARFRCQCPAHGGNDKNLEFREIYPGRITFTCYSHGCGWHEVVDALGLSREDFYPAHELRQWDTGRDYTPSEDEFVVACARDSLARGDKLKASDMERYQVALVRLYQHKGVAM